MRRFCLCLIACIALAHAENFKNTETATRYAAFSIVSSIEPTASGIPDSGDGSVSAQGIVPQIGVVEKHPSNPLLIQDQPWEQRLDNGYPNVLHNPDDPNGAFRIWYGGFIACEHCDTTEGSKRVNAWHYANSSDGLQWEKPKLGIFDLSKCKVRDSNL